jgi:hypothetical protein
MRSINAKQITTIIHINILTEVCMLSHGSVQRGVKIGLLTAQRMEVDAMMDMSDMMQRCMDMIGGSSMMGSGMMDGNPTS